MHAVTLLRYMLFLIPVWSDHKPDILYIFTAGVAGGFILGEVIQRMSVISYLGRVVGPRGRPEQVRLYTASGNRHSFGQERRPDGGAGVIAGAGIGGVHGVHIKAYASIV